MLASLLTGLFCYENVPLKRAQNGSRLSAGSLRYAIAHSGGTGDGIRFPSKCFQSFEIAVYLSVAVKRIVVVKTEVMEAAPKAQPAPTVENQPEEKAAPAPKVLDFSAAKNKAPAKEETWP